MLPGWNSVFRVWTGDTRDSTRDSRYHWNSVFRVWTGDARHGVCRMSRRGAGRIAAAGASRARASREVLSSQHDLAMTASLLSYSSRVQGRAEHGRAERCMSRDGQSMSEERAEGWAAAGASRAGVRREVMRRGEQGRGRQRAEGWAAAGASAHGCTVGRHRPDPSRGRRPPPPPSDVRVRAMHGRTVRLECAEAVDCVRRGPHGLGLGRASRQPA
jgi:hypothetical protein